MRGAAGEEEEDCAALFSLRQCDQMATHFEPILGNFKTTKRCPID